LQGRKFTNFIRLQKIYHVIITDHISKNAKILYSRSSQKFVF